MATEKKQWTITALTIPEREEYLKNLIVSLNQTPLASPAEIVIVYNRDAGDGAFEIEERIKSYSSKLPISVYFNSNDPSIVGGRIFQLNVCKTPLICFIDDDVTLHGNIFPALEESLRTLPMGIVGVRSYSEESDKLFKPKETTPHITTDKIRYETVQGMLNAGYTNLFRQVGGFNPRRKFWGEWTELNLRMWRHGFPTGYNMNCGFLRHWEKAPASPTRNMTGRERFVLWGLICTALEYDAVDITEATETFWRLVEDRYLAYSFGDGLSHKNLLRTTLELMPKLSSEWGNIAAFKLDVAEHPFKFAPFHPLTEKDINAVLGHAEKQIQTYRNAVWGKKAVRIRLRDIGQTVLNKMGALMFGKRPSGLL
ncbi:MAG: glycosyltransferase family 2 protein [Rhizobacter sp.]|nr:glycosyltransferase family 2 protein [Chlorobiales bacterium]